MTTPMGEALAGLPLPPRQASRLEKQIMARRSIIDLAVTIRWARLEYAVTRWESAVTIGFMIVAVSVAYLLSGTDYLPGGSWIAVLAFCLVAEAALITSSAADPTAGADLVIMALETRLGVVGVRDTDVRDQVGRAVEYRVRIQDVLGRKSKALREATTETVAAVDSWLHGVGRLAKRLDRIREDASFQAADKFRLRERIDDLEARAQATSDGKVRLQFRETIAGRRLQLRKIEELEGLIERGELRLEHAVGALGTIYSQITIFAAQGIDQGDAARLAREISDEIEQVDALLVAIDRIGEPEALAIEDKP